MHITETDRNQRRDKEEGGVMCEIERDQRDKEEAQSCVTLPLAASRLCHGETEPMKIAQQCLQRYLVADPVNR